MKRKYIECMTSDDDVMVTCSAARARDQQQQAASKRRTRRREDEQLAGDVDVEQKPTEEHDQLAVRRNDGWDRERRELLAVGRRLGGVVEIGDETGRQKQDVVAGQDDDRCLELSTDCLVFRLRYHDAWMRPRRRHLATNTVQGLNCETLAGGLFFLAARDFGNTKCNLDNVL